VDRTTLYRLLERHGFRREFGESVPTSEPRSDSPMLDTPADLPQASAISDE